MNLRFFTLVQCIKGLRFPKIITFDCVESHFKGVLMEEYCTLFNVGGISFERAIV